MTDLIERLDEEIESGEKAVAAPGDKLTKGQIEKVERLHQLLKDCRYALNKHECPFCGAENKKSALLCSICDRVLP